MTGPLGDYGVEPTSELSVVIPVYNERQWMQPGVGAFRKSQLLITAGRTKRGTKKRRSRRKFVRVSLGEVQVCPLYFGSMNLRFRRRNTANLGRTQVDGFRRRARCCSA